MATNGARPGTTPLDLDVCTVDKTGNKRLMPRLFDHVDLRVPRLAEVTAFYELLLPALGFTRRKEQTEGWLEFEAPGYEATAFFGITESAAHVVNENRIAFWAETAADVDRVAGVAKCAGARNMEGPMDYAPGYYAVFFEDPCGNRLEVCHRVRR
jgi:predicted enzyme related to lactoylglutathione lyase